ncbi:Aste57867_12197 [Aphanomyces stellatus]|uniref:Aste57867_12197 protein n=1 Tax=Aphanomyces stellatus TaxID=120398 RepID=A0A485KUW7_9STRA|nr:hypothetical protein As57867_012152 [Aphanomyces stellatus]VFT89051.1 Aste57867_12197 [Aphanomyces stellatus]
MPPPRGGGRKRDGIKKKPKASKKAAAASTSVEALVVYKTKLTPAAEAKLFDANKAALEKSSHDRFVRAVYSVILQYHQPYIDWYPNDPKSYERQGYSYYHLHDYVKTIERLSQAVYLGANSGKMWRTLARACWLLYKQNHDWGLLWDAKSCYENGMRFIEVCTSPYAMFEFARVLEGLGEFDHALGVIRTLLFSFPTFAKLDEVVLRAVILMFHSIVFQKQTPATVDAKAKQDMLEQCCDYCKFIIDKDVSKTDLYLTVLYVTARIHEVTAISRTVKYAAKTYEELYRVGLHLGVIEPILGKGWMDWFRTCTTWHVWIAYFEKRDELVLAVDAAQEGIKRVDTREWDRTTFCWEPETSMWYTLGSLFFKCNDMVPAVAAMETSLYFGRYRTDVRGTLLEWYPQQWSAPLASEVAAQVQLSAMLRGVWGRDRAKRQKVLVIESALAEYAASPYTALRARKVLVKYKGEKYPRVVDFRALMLWLAVHCRFAPLFAAQDMASRTLQKLARTFIKHMHAFYTHEANRRHRIQAIEGRLAGAPYDRLLRTELAQLSPHHRTIFLRQSQAALAIQCLYRGHCTRVLYDRLLTQEHARQAENQRVSDAASMIQRRFRYIRSNALLHTRHILRHKKERLAVNLQRLWRRKKSLLVQFLERQAGS